MHTKLIKLKTPILKLNHKYKLLSKKLSESIFFQYSSNLFTHFVIFFQLFYFIYFIFNFKAF